MNHLLAMTLACGASMAVSGTSFGKTEPGAVDVRNHGARGDGKTKDTKAVQAAIDACVQKGGGTVYFPAGNFLCGSLHLASRVRLHLDSGAVLLASKEKADFDPYEPLGFKNAADSETSFFHHALIWAEDAERIAITGTGTIDGNRKRRGGPKPIALKRCKDVVIRDITILDSPNYCISLLGTDYVTIDGVTIRNGYSDGIDPDCCHHVRIANCHIESWDDAIVPKASFSLGRRRSTENVTVTNCVLATNCNAFKLGTESGGDFRNITLSNCAMFARAQGRPPISGVSLLTVDGSTIEGVAISNIAMTDVCCPLFLRLGNRGRDLAKPEPGRLRQIVVSDLVATGAQWPCTVAGIPGHPVEGVTFSNFRIAAKGGSARVEGVVAEHVAKYPSADMFGKLPAYGFFCRHARDLHLSKIHFTSSEGDRRHAVVCDDVSRLAIDSLEAPVAKEGESVLRFGQVRQTLIRGCMPDQGTEVFLKVVGTQNQGIRLVGNDFSGVRKPVELVEGAGPHCVEISDRR